MRTHIIGDHHPHKRKVVKVELKSPIASGFDAGKTTIERFEIEDWFDTLGGKSWMDAEGNWAALGYAMRSGFSQGRIPVDDEVVYGHNLDSGMGHAVHVSELVIEEVTA